ncbi:spinster family MFS transporter [Allosphingosinicella deserti]|uniref:MFS transporter n=1 Tax=Allosphingosinicella deserti TaxID=2116704 RepID=A0A2P7QLW5_9SPHN|nr:MFS transporter [Sphingomonas deserti]PSJ38957.1 MFS transporter [Sphingomonas deserti]
MDERKTSRGGRVLAILLLAYIFNFIDRQIIGVLAVPIRAEFDLDDKTLSYLGVVFALFYSTIAIPIAWLADRKSRVAIIAGSVAVWSLFTAACGLVQSYGQLVAARMGVAFGEAGGIAPSYSLISDYFPKSRRARAMAVFSLGIPLGSALGIFFGGWLASHLSWRSAFLIVGLAGLPAALLIKLLIKDPQRGALDSDDGAVSAPAPPLGVVMAALARNPSFWLLSFGAASGSILGYGLIFWLPSFFNRSFDLPLSAVGWFYGSIVLVGGVAGTWLGGWIGDRVGPAHPGRYALIPATCFLIAAPAFALGLFAPNLWSAWLLFALGQMLALAWLGPVISAIQHIVPANMRSTTSASFLFINNLIGIAVGNYFLGWMSDRLKAEHGADSLQYSILYGLGFYLLSALLYFVASRRLARDWYRG